MFSRVTSRISARFPNAINATPKASRSMAHAKKPATPYDLPKQQTYPDQAYPFGLTPNYKTEGWEVITWVTYAACTLLLVVGVGSQNNDTFKSWCRREALARETHEENGGEVEFGKYYQKIEYQIEGEVGAVPSIKGRD